MICQNFRKTTLGWFLLEADCVLLLVSELPCLPEPWSIPWLQVTGRGPGFPTALVCRQWMVAGGGMWQETPIPCCVSSTAASGPKNSTTLRTSCPCVQMLCSGTRQMQMSRCKHLRQQLLWRKMTALGRSKERTARKTQEAGYQREVASHHSNKGIGLWLEGNQGMVQQPGGNAWQKKKNKKTYTSFNEGHDIYVSDKRNKYRMYGKIWAGRAYFWAINIFS